MRRSEINHILREGRAFIEACGFSLPPFASYTPERWRAGGEELAEIRRCRLGWDITDYGGGDFAHLGLFLFTMRNGTPGQADGCGKTYAEKLMISCENQLSPMHFHRTKTEDIINRAGGVLMVQLYNSTTEEELSSTPVTVRTDGISRTLPAGGTLALAPGQSVTLPPRLYHAFWAKRGSGRVLVGEVSRVNDDERDNRFHRALPRFPEIEEDEPPLYLLCGEYGEE